MARRRRYDTEALVGQLKSERRAGILLSLAGIGILLFLVILYVTGVGDDDEIPKVPIESTAAKLATEAAKADAAGAELAANNPTETADTAKPTEATEEPPPPPPDNSPVQVSLSLSKKGIVWVDKKKLGKFKKKQLELSPGVHLIKVKVGRKTVKSKIEIKSGENVAVIIDHRKKKITVKPKK